MATLEEILDGKTSLNLMGGDIVTITSTNGEVSSVCVLPKSRSEGKVLDEWGWFWWFLVVVLL